MPRAQETQAVILKLLQILHPDTQGIQAKPLNVKPERQIVHTVFDPVFTQLPQLAGHPFITQVLMVPLVCKR